MISRPERSPTAKKKKMVLISLIKVTDVLKSVTTDSKIYLAEMITNRKRYVLHLMMGALGEPTGLLLN